MLTILANCPFLDSVNLLKICNQTRHRSVEMGHDAELFNGTAAAWAAGGKNEGPTQIADLKADNAGNC